MARPRRHPPAPGLLFAMALALGAFGAVGLRAQELSAHFLQAEIWCELEPMVQDPGERYPLSKDAAIKQILTEARFVFSGMLYGFDFVYTPADPGRGVAGLFTLTPVAEIPWGDPRLEVLQTRTADTRLYANLLYNLAPFQERWRTAWESNLFPTAGGRGEGSYYGGLPQKMLSYRNAIREAIRAYLQARVYNRPRVVRGQVELAGQPETVVGAGKFITTVSVRLKIAQVEPYSVY